VPSDVNTAQVVIRRLAALSTLPYTFTVLVDGHQVGTLPNGGSLTVQAAPGRHTITVRPPRLSGIPRSEVVGLTFDQQQIDAS
jgi:hypothetical protein